MKYFKSKQNVCINMTAEQYDQMVERFFRSNPTPTCDEVKATLVPIGVENTAREGRFKIDEIFKYKFKSSDGVDLMVKYHSADPYVKRIIPESNSAKGWTAQIICNERTFFLWEPIEKKASRIRVSKEQVRTGKAPKCSEAHILLSAGPSKCTENSN